MERGRQYLAPVNFHVCLGWLKLSITLATFFGCWCKTTVGMPWNGPQMTAFVTDEVPTLVPSPRPTSGPKMQFRRQSHGPDTCGFIDGDIGKPLTCSTHSLTCVTNTGLEAFACCSTATAGSLSGSFTDCKFRTACVDTIAQISNSTGGINPLIRTCFPSSPFCQQYDLIGLGTNNDASEILRNFECGSSPLSQIVKPSFIVSVYSAASSSVLSSSAPSATPAAAISSKGLPNGQKIGIGVGVPIALISITMACFIYYRKLSLAKNLILSARQEHQPVSSMRASEKSKVKDTRTFEPQMTKTFMDRLNSMSSYNIDDCRNFLSIYGGQGVWLQELLMLVRVMSFPATRFAEDRIWHWSQAGLRYPEGLSSYDILLLDLVRKASSDSELHALEQKLVASNVLEVGRSLSEASQDHWSVHGRLWFAKRPNTVKSKVHCQTLMELYLRIPDRYIGLLAERHREVCYYHAHVAIAYVFPMVADKVKMFHGHEDPLFHAFFDVVVKVLSYRYHEKDAGLLELIKRLPFSALVKSPELPCSLSLYDKSQIHFRQVMLYLADLRRIESQAGVRKHSLFLDLIPEKLKYLQNTVPRRQEIGYQAWGMIGYALADLMDISERTHDQGSIEKILTLMREWCDTALVSRSPIELAALCCVLVELKAFQELDTIPQEYHLMCGHYLSRSGMQQLASQFILSGIHYCEQETPLEPVRRYYGGQETRKEPIWRYYLEFWTIAMSQGYWDETESWLSIASKDIWQRSGALPDGGPDFLQESGELKEFKATLAALLSDCYVAQGNYQVAASMLVMAIENTSPSHDGHMTNTRVALWSRLLNVQMELHDLQRAGILAATLCYELGDQVTSIMTSQTTSWAAQEVLSCANELVRAEMCGEAYYILCLLRQSMLFPEDDSALVNALPQDLINYINQRWDEVKSIFDPAGIVQEQHHRAVYKFGQLELLTSSLEKLYELGDLGLLQTSPGEFCTLADSLIRFPPENQNVTPSLPHHPHFVKSLSGGLENCLLYRNNLWKGNDMGHLESLLSEARILPEQSSASEEAPASTCTSASILDIARHIARDHRYTFPLTSMDEGTTMQISKTPKRGVFPTSGMAQTQEKQQMLKNKKRDTWQARRLKNFRTLWQLKTPTGPVIPPLTTDLERGEKSGSVPIGSAPPLTSEAYTPIELSGLPS